MSQKTVDVLLKANIARFNSAMRSASQATKSFTSGARAELSRLKTVATSVKGQLGALGLGVGLTKLSSDAAKFEKEMRLLEVSTGGSRDEMEGWRNDMLAHQQVTGTTVTAQQELSDSLQAVGLGMGEIRSVLGPASETMAVARTNADALGKALGVANEQFGAEVDLRSQESVRKTLDQMLVAGRLGNAELEDLPNIFARIGGRAKEANLTLTQTLAITEALSQAEPQAERLATLTDSTLRVFTNAKYMKEAQSATGVQFFDKEGSRRDPIVVLGEIKKRFDVLKTDAQRMKFIDDAFGKTDLDTQRGLKKLLDDGSLNKIAEFEKEIAAAAGQSKKDLAVATNNLTDQSSRLTAALRKSVDNGFARPFNDAIAGGIKKLLDTKENGGMGLDGDQMIMGAAGTAALAYGLYRAGGPMVKKLMGTGGGVATGKALEAAAGVMPVYVVNMGEGGMDGLGGLSKTGGLPGTGGIAGAGGGAGAGAAAGGGWGLFGSMMAGAAPLAAMWGVSEWAGDTSHDKERTESLGGFTDSLRNFLGMESSEARSGRLRNERDARQEGYEGPNAVRDWQLASGKRSLDLTDMEQKGFYAGGDGPGNHNMINSRYGRNFMAGARGGQSEDKIKTAADQFERVNQAMLSEVKKTKLEGTILISLSGAGAIGASVMSSGTENLKFKTGGTMGTPS